MYPRPHINEELSCTRRASSFPCAAQAKFAEFRTACSLAPAPPSSLSMALPPPTYHSMAHPPPIVGSPRYMTVANMASVVGCPLSSQSSQTSKSSSHRNSFSMAPLVSRSSSRASQRSQLAATPKQKVAQLTQRAQKKWNQLDVDQSGCLEASEVLALATWVWRSLHPGEMADPTAIQEEVSPLTPPAVVNLHHNTFSQI
jgi:hypothetical protein